MLPNAPYSDRLAFKVQVDAVNLFFLLGLVVVDVALS